jgi:peptide deformylase
MWEALEREKGVGLAAPQVGVDLKIAVMAVGPRRWVLGNPRILRHKGPKIAIPEGCLSLPGVSYLVPRWMEIRGAYVDLRGVIRVETFKGLAAQAFQHELDHLNGVLIDKIGTRMN